jgi:hypothetical protein
VCSGVPRNTTQEDALYKRPILGNLEQYGTDMPYTAPRRWKA